MLKYNLKAVYFFIILTLALSLILSAVGQTKADTILDKVRQGGLDQVGQAYQSGAPQDIRLTIVDIINVFLSLLGVLSLVIIIYGGFKWMTAGGNEENVATAKKILTAGIIGLVIILSAYVLANFVINQILGAVTGREQTDRTLNSVNNQENIYYP